MLKICTKAKQQKVNPASWVSLSTTGNYLVLLPEDDVDAGVQALCNSTGVSHVARAMEMTDRVFTAEQLEDIEPLVFEQLGVAVVPLDPEQLQSLSVLEKPQQLSKKHPALYAQLQCYYQLNPLQWD